MSFFNSTQVLKNSDFENKKIFKVITQAKAMGFDIYAELAELIPQGRVMVNELFTGMLLPMMPDSLSTPLSQLIGDDVFQGKFDIFLEKNYYYLKVYLMSFLESSHL